MIETATSVCSVALFDRYRLVDYGHAVVARGHAERLLPMIAALDGGGRAEAIHVDVGPGSFTGVRVGVAAARALGFGWGVPVSGFASLALLAAIDGSRDDTLIAIEGGHGELFVARYAADGSVRSAPRSLPFAEAVLEATEPRVVGNAANRLIAARGWGEGFAVDPDARLAISVEAALAPVPIYGRSADAKPMMV